MHPSGRRGSCAAAGRGVSSFVPGSSAAAAGGTRHGNLPGRLLRRPELGQGRGEGLRVFLDAEHFFDGWLRNQAYAFAAISAAVDAGAEVVALCDTNGGMLPSQISDVVGEVVSRFDDAALVGIHCHNDCDVAVANTLAAVGRGATQVQGTINGIGERCGNVDLVSVIANLALKRGYEVLGPGSLSRLTEVSRYV